MKSALAYFLERYDLVILDSPPMMAVADARIISRLADYTAKTPREVVINALNLLRTVTQRVGIVVNRVDLAKHVRYGYGAAGTTIRDIAPTRALAASLAKRHRARPLELPARGGFDVKLQHAG